MKTLGAHSPCRDLWRHKQTAWKLAKEISASISHPSAAANGISISELTHKLNKTQMSPHTSHQKRTFGNKRSHLDEQQFGSRSWGRKCSFFSSDRPSVKTNCHHPPNGARSSSSSKREEQLNPQARACWEARLVRANRFFRTFRFKHSIQGVRISKSA